MVPVGASADPYRLRIAVSQEAKGDLVSDGEEDPTYTEANPYVCPIVPRERRP